MTCPQPIGTRPTADRVRLASLLTLPSGQRHRQVVFGLHSHDGTYAFVREVGLRRT
jgi:hypothetical protein